MQVVGNYLTEQALHIRGSSPDDVLFARSAFNRYYYATFLASRLLVLETTGVKPMSHRALPEYLTGHFRKTMKRQIAGGFRSGLFTDARRGQLLNILNENTGSLSDLLSQAYNVRVLADYEPDVPVEINADTYKLGVATLSSAGKWVSRAQMYRKNLYRIWKDLGN